MVFSPLFEVKYGWKEFKMHPSAVHRTIVDEIMQTATQIVEFQIIDRINYFPDSKNKLM